MKFYHNAKLDMLLPLNYVSTTKEDNYPIDLVYLWTDGDDEKVKKLREEWKIKLNIQNKTSKDNIRKGRYVDNQELKYSLRSVEKFAPWIHKIYIVAQPGQRPKWLNAKHPKIVFVDQNSIMPEEAKPSFNSNAIEHCLMNIPNLSEHFLYSNDDMMFINYVYPEDFFKDGKPIYSIYPGYSYKYTNDGGYSTFLLNSYNLAVKKFGKVQKLSPSHNIVPYSKSSMIKCKQAFKEDIEETIRHHFRLSTDIQRLIYAYYAIWANDAYYKLLDKNPYFLPIKLPKYRFTKYYCIDQKLKNIKKDLKKLYNVKLLCTNDCANTTDEDRILYKQIMEEIFPEKSSFEK